MGELSTWATDCLGSLVRHGSPHGPQTPRNLLLHDDEWAPVPAEEVESQLQRLRSPSTSTDNLRSGKCAVTFERPLNGHPAVWIDAFDFQAGHVRERVVFAQALHPDSSLVEITPTDRPGTHPSIPDPSPRPGFVAMAPQQSRVQGFPAPVMNPAHGTPWGSAAPPHGPQRADLSGVAPRSYGSTRATFWWTSLAGPVIGAVVAIISCQRAKAHGLDGSGHFVAWAKATAISVGLYLLVIFAGGALLTHAVSTTASGSDASAQSPPTDSSTTSGGPAGGWAGGTDTNEAPPPNSTPTSTTPPTISTITASCAASPSIDASGNPVQYTPDRMMDGSTDTAWRCDGDGTGQSVDLVLTQQTTISSIGLIPGYSKIDQTDGTDRYQQNRRISAVRYEFDSGQSVTQTLDTSASNRQLQKVAVGNLISQHVHIVILGSEPGNPSGAQPPTDKIAISEIAVS